MIDFGKKKGCNLREYLVLKGIHLFHGLALQDAMLESVSCKMSVGQDSQ